MHSIYINKKEVTKLLFNNKNFKLKEGVFDFDIKDSVTSRVKKFYEEDPFPNYRVKDNKQTILEIHEYMIENVT